MQVEPGHMIMSDLIKSILIGLLFFNVDGHVTWFDLHIKLSLSILFIELPGPPRLPAGQLSCPFAHPT